MRSATILTAIAGGVLVGIFFASFISAEPIVLGAFLISAFSIFSFSLCRWRVFVFLVGIILIGASVGVWRFDMASQSFNATSFSNIGESATIVGSVRDVDKRIDKTFIVLSADEGDVRITLYSSAIIREGTIVTMRGVLEDPPEFDDFDYVGYLRSKGINAIMTNAVLVEENEPSGIIGSTREALSRGLNLSIASPEVALAEAMVLGNKGLISTKDNEILIASGTRHLVAISGLHMMLIAELLLAMFVLFGLWRQYAVIATILVLAFYVVIVGFPASAVRAFLFVVAFESARMVGRPGRGIRAVLLVATGMVIWNPFLLRWDVGFQLSFLAVVGIGLFAPVIEQFLNSYPLGPLRRVIAMSLSAMLTTMPLVAYTFGRVSLVAPLGNIVALPFVPLLVGGGIIAAIIGAFLPSAAALIGFPVWGLFAVVRRLLSIVAMIPGSLFEVSLSWIIVLLWEVAVAWWAFRLYKRRMMPRWEYDTFLKSES